MALRNKTRLTVTPKRHMALGGRAVTKRKTIPRIRIGQTWEMACGDLVQIVEMEEWSTFKFGKWKRVKFPWIGINRDGIRHFTSGGKYLIRQKSPYDLVRLIRQPEIAHAMRDQARAAL